MKISNLHEWRQRLSSKKRPSPRRGRAPSPRTRMPEHIPRFKTQQTTTGRHWSKEVITRRQDQQQALRLIAGVSGVLLLLVLVFSCTFGNGETPVASARRKNSYDDREVVCWGDSLTEGIGADVAVIQTSSGTYDASFKSYPEILEDLCGLKVYNFGVTGATSEEILAMRESSPINMDGEPYEVFDNIVAARGLRHLGDILVVEIGSNGGWDSNYAKLISQYRRLIEFSDCKDYIVVGDTDDPGTSLADDNQYEFEQGDDVQETEWEHALQDAFGSHFINMRMFLINHGLEVCGLERTPEDDELAEQGRVPRRLRADWTHLNSYGYYAQAMGIYDKGIALGYWKRGRSSGCLAGDLGLFYHVDRNDYDPILIP